MRFPPGPHLKIFHSANPRQEATQALAKIFKEYVNVPVLFLSSGGSALSLLTPEILTENPQLTVSVLDEHYVADPNELNFEKLKKTEFFGALTQQPPSSQTRTPPLLRGVQTPHPTSPLKRGGGTTFDPYGGEVGDAGKRFDTFLKQWRAKYPQGRIVVTVGMGPDGHTAGIVPFSDAVLFKKLFDTPETLAVGYKTDYGTFPERVTATFSLLKVASDVILYAAGEEKRKTIETCMQKEKPVNEFPAMFLKTLPQTTFFTDFNEARK